MASVDLSPLAHMALLGLALALGPLAWIALRHRRVSPAARLRALTALTLFLTFDLVLFGAFTRLTDSGLGCPDWPGCYGHASPLGAQAHIEAAQSALPTGPVTHAKAWVEMIHRYLATGVGVLIVVGAVAHWRLARKEPGAASPGWALATLAWVCAQGAFGALTVTWRLYPAMVTAHLLGGLGLLALLAVQTQAARRGTLALPAPLHAGVVAVLALAVVQCALGGWVSSNYAVLACRDFPACQGSWWPPMDLAQGFTLRRELGLDGDGRPIAFAALTAIHWVHRLGAAVVLSALAVLAWRLARGGDATRRRFARALLGVGAWQFATGLGNVVLGWPLAAAVAHAGGAAALVVVLTALLARARPVSRRAVAAPSREARAPLSRPTPVS